MISSFSFFHEIYPFDCGKPINGLGEFGRWRQINKFPSHRVKNDVKQGVVISPVLCCIYIDKLLFHLDDNGVGCYICKMFVSALTYTGESVLIAPASRTMRRMLSTCDSFADNFSIVFNA